MVAVPTACPKCQCYKLHKSLINKYKFSVAEREGFEPPIELPLCRISSAVHSTTLPPLREAKRASTLLVGGAYDIATPALQQAWGALCGQNRVCR
jgi:hypothetical protein